MTSAAWREALDSFTEGDIMIDYKQELREAVLAGSKNNTPKEKADALNLIECIIEGYMSVNDIVEGIKNDTIPKRYLVK